LWWTGPIHRLWRDYPVSGDIRLVLWLAAAVDTVGAVGFFVLAARLHRAVAATRTWPAVTGRITASRLVPGRRTAAADVAYAYAIGGRTYTGNRVQVAHRLGDFLIAMSHRHAQTLLERYPPDATVLVYYDPARPEEAVLEPGEGSHLVRVLVIAGCVVMVVAAIFATIAWGSG
jgi:hypothetical protein